MMTPACAIHTCSTRAQAHSAARAWAQETAAVLVCPEIPLLGAYSVAENLALVRQLQAGTPAWRAHPLAAATLERAGLAHLGARNADGLAARDTLAVKCLAAAMQPAGRVAIACGGHMDEDAVELATISRMIGLFADRWRRCDLFVEEARAGLIQVV